MTNGNGTRKKHLSAGDSLFLYLEREASPMSIGAAMEFEGVMRLPDCLEFVSGKLPLIPRYTERVVFPALNSAYPAWEPDPKFDIRNHVHEVTLREGTEEEWKSRVSDIFSVMLDRERPLWDITLFHGLKRNRTGLLARVHHCLVDGVGGVGLMNVLMDADPKVTPPKRTTSSKGEDLSSTTNQDAGAKLLQQLITSYLGAVQGVLQVQKDVLSAAELMTHAGRSAIEQMLSVAPEIVMPAERLPFNKLCRGPQKFAWTSLPIKPLLAVKEKCGATLNDVVLGIVTRAFAKYSVLHKVQVRGRTLRLIIPVNIRGNGDVSELGNRISFAPVNIAMDIPDPRRLMEEVKERMCHVKSSHLAEYVGLAGMLITSLPIPLQALALPYAGTLPISLSNLICTNVPGPRQPLYFMGHKMLTWYPHVPIGGEMGVNAAVLTYNGTAYFGFTIDLYAAPDAEVLETLLAESATEFATAFGVRAENKAVSKRAPRAKRTAAKKAAVPKPMASASTISGT